jgi:pyruvate/2-oxoglutarate dehydrogenase complex dihydrolipoamide dehydrogenase (E3) component
VPPANQAYDLVVIGSGTAAMVAATRVHGVHSLAQQALGF